MSFTATDSARLTTVPYVLETELLPISNYQGNAVVNYTSSEVPFTRIIEHKHFESLTQKDVEANPVTVISTRIFIRMEGWYGAVLSCQRCTKQDMYERYRMLAEQEPNVIFRRPSGSNINTTTWPRL